LERSGNPLGQYSICNIQYSIRKWLRFTRYEIRDTLRASRRRAHKKTFLCKTNPISPDFAPKTAVWKKNKPNQSQFKPNSNPIQSQSNPISETPKMNVNLYVIEDYENETVFRPKNTNPNKPNFKPPPLVAAKPLAKPDAAVPQFLSAIASAKADLLFPFYFLLTSATREFRAFAQPE